MIANADEVNAILSIDPDVDPEIFWPRVGLDAGLMSIVGKATRS